MTDNKGTIEILIAQELSNIWQQFIAYINILFFVYLLNYWCIKKLRKIDLILIQKCKINNIKYKYTNTFNIVKKQKQFS